MPNTMSKAAELGTYRITKVVHEFTQNDRYECRFEGIPADLKSYPLLDVEMPVAVSEIGTVISNADPDGQGRVRVEFPFAEDRVSDTWFRVMSLNAGLTRDEKKNRGMVFIPEAGDQVMMCFEGGDPNRPYVTGSMFHGKSGQGGGQNNHLKSIISLCNHTLELDDSPETLGITLKDKKGNSFHIDTKGGNIDITALNTITLNAKNISLNASENLSGYAGKNINMHADKDIGHIAGDDYQVSSNNIYTQASTDSMHTAKKYEAIAEKLRVDSTDENLELASNKEVDVQSAKKVRLF